MGIVKGHRNRRRLVAGAVAAVVVAGAGGVGVAWAHGDDGPLATQDRQAAESAALGVTGGGTVTDVERDDGGYEVDVRRVDGSEAEVRLGGDLGVVRVEEDDSADGGPDDDVLSVEAYDQAAAAALAAAGGGRVVEADRDDDGYDVEVLREDGSRVEFELDDTFAVVDQDVDGD